MIVRSKYLIDSTGRAIEEVEVAIEGGRIVSVRRRSSDETPPESEVIDLGHAAILPGLINAHAHLELTHAHTLVEPQPRFTDWIREVVRATSSWSEDSFNESLRDGLKLSAESGTTSIGDIGRGAIDISAYSESGMRVRLFQEVIGFDPSAAEGIINSLKQSIDRIPSSGPFSAGICPHTPYTVSDYLLKQCARVARERELPLCIHLAETMAELEFLGQGEGEILDFRQEFGMWSEWKPPRASPVRYLHHLGFFERPTTLIHCNYVREDDFDIIGMSGSSVVFCPRSHDYFLHRNHPFLKMLGHGINVALGTDSLISSPSLSILDEMKFLRECFADIDSAVLLRMATTNGAKALGLPVGVGRLAPGSPADMIGVALPEAGPAGDPLDAVLSAGSKVVFSMAAGEILYSSQSFKEGT